jgi:predicted nucleic acid-binding protein
VAVLDTNVVVRFLTLDHPEQSIRARDFIATIVDGRQVVTLPEAVFVEIVHVLSSPDLYALTRGEIRDRVIEILRVPGVRMSRKATYYRALDLFFEHRQLSIVDAICAATAESEAEPTVVSFDREFRRVDSIVWLQP